VEQRRDEKALMGPSQIIDFLHRNELLKCGSLRTNVERKNAYNWQCNERMPVNKMMLVMMMMKMMDVWLVLKIDRVLLLAARNFSYVFHAV
jgi:hypothetical protein